MRTRTLFVTLALLIAQCDIVSAATCHHSVPRGKVGYWKYRMVNGERCWYPASRKARAAIATQKKPIATPKPVESKNPTKPVWNDPPEGTVWPILTDFDLRFVGEL